MTPKRVISSQPAPISSPPTVPEGPRTAGRVGHFGTSGAGRFLWSPNIWGHLQDGVIGTHARKVTPGEFLWPDLLLEK
jgi:hypothetical protein